MIKIDEMSARFLDIRGLNLPLLIISQEYILKVQDIL